MMRAAGIDVVLTDLTQLQDSNPFYSGIWRWLFRPFGNSEGGILPNPFGPGKVSIRSYLALLNFKANHRKLIVVDDADGEYHALVSSANPHDGSSAHRNVALQFSGNAAIDVLLSEQTLLTMSGAEASWFAWPATLQDRLNSRYVQTSWQDSKFGDIGDIGNVADGADGANSADSAGDTNSPDVDNADKASRVTVDKKAGASLQIVSESRIEAAVLNMLSTAQAGDQVDLVMFYLSDRDIVEALKVAHARGVKLRVLLDVNQDAFGRKKKGVPNRPVAAELVEQGIPVRWCVTVGEQCHAKMLYRINNAGARLLLGSGNYTRRNLEDYNLETNAWLKAPSDHPAVIDAVDYFDVQWSNSDGRTYSVDYQQYANESVWLKWRYRIMEASGFATF